MYATRTFVNSATPGTYSTILNNTFMANNLPEIINPSEPPTQKIITAFTNTETSSHPPIQSRQRRDPRKRKCATERERPHKTVRETKQTKPTQNQTKVTKGAEIGLKIYTPRATG